MTDSPASGHPADPLADALAHRVAGRFREAAVLFRAALAADSGNPAILLRYAETLYRLGRLHAAHDALANAAARAPGDADLQFLLGRVLTALGHSDAAAVAFQNTVRLQPENAAAWRLMAPPLFALGRHEDADAAFRHADELQAETPAGYNQLGGHFIGERRAVEAEAAFRRALALTPKDAAAHQNLAVALAFQDRLDEATQAARQATEMAPHAASVWATLATFETARGHFAEGRRAIMQAARIDPETPETLGLLAGLRVDEGDAAGAIALLERTLARRPDNPSIAANLLMARNYVDSDPGAALAGARRVTSALRPPDAGDVELHDNNRNPARRLRVGYVSADFRQHSCASFLRPLFAAHDPAAVEIVAYADNVIEDRTTAELRSHSALWRPTASLTDAALAELIRRDRIDILVDLAGHTSGNRLQVFARKPAPVQVSWLGYPATTGLKEIDYRLTDEVADPPGAADRHHSERLWRLPAPFLAYAADMAAPAGAGPRDAGAPPVFGSFNHLPKVTPEVVAAWARVLHAVPGARLLMKARRLGEPETASRYRELFKAHGIAADRLELIGWQAAPEDHLALYRRIDVALDPFPYNGTTTTCEALWMGVPVITLAGDRHAGRVGASLLGAVGLGEFVATSIDDYVARAASLAADPIRLGELRAGMRERMRASPLCDTQGFVRRLEAAYRAMWREWCGTAGG